jgi:hypothetical protein
MSATHILGTWPILSMPRELQVCVVGVTILFVTETGRLKGTGTVASV